MMRWGEKRYHSMDYDLKQAYGEKVYKITLDGGMTCPNRDGTLGTRGCIFCSQGGSGEFAAAHTGIPSIDAQIGEAVSRISRKMGKNPGAYIAYFQSYTNTYAPVSYLEPLFTAAIRHPAEKDVEVSDMILVTAFKVAIAHGQLVKVAEHGHVQLFLSFHFHTSSKFFLGVLHTIILSFPETGNPFPHFSPRSSPFRRFFPDISIKSVYQGLTK